jgi:hypothetical protein
MPDMLKQGLQWLAQQRTRHMASEVTYQRGGQSVMVQATIGRTEYDVTDSAGASLTTHVMDFLILADDLVDLHPPRRGDLILVPGPGLSSHQQYEVLDLPAQGCWRWSDPYRTTLRIHTKDIGPPGIQS